MAMRQESVTFDQSVYALASLVPVGYVTTYGHLAALLGRPTWSRRVGLSLSRAEESAPCHRVVSSQGRLVPGWARQRELLLCEGVEFRENGCVNMKKHRLTVQMWQDILG